MYALDISNHFPPEPVALNLDANVMFSRVIERGGIETLTIAEKDSADAAIYFDKIRPLHAAKRVNGKWQSKMEQHGEGNVYMHDIDAVLDTYISNVDLLLRIGYIKVLDVNVIREIFEEFIGSSSPQSPVLM